MQPEMKERTTETAVPWAALTTQQQASVTNELARLLCQYVQGNQTGARLRQNQEGPNEQPSQDS
jgi:hypothetical protein